VLFCSINLYSLNNAITPYYWFCGPNSSAAAAEDDAANLLFQEQGFHITFCKSAQRSEFMIDLSVYKVDKRSYSMSFDVYVKELNPSIVLFDRFAIEEQLVGALLRCPSALRILDTEIYILCDR
jgi:hypothetical protein